MAISDRDDAFEKALERNFENNSPINKAKAAYYMTMVDREKAAIRRENNPKTAAKERIETLKAVGKFVQSTEGQQLLNLKPEQLDLFQQLTSFI